MKGKSIRNTPPLNTPPPPPSLPVALSPFPILPQPPVIFYSLTRGEFNKYMQMCAVEHDECKSGEDVLWALPRLRLRADPGLIIFHFPIAFNSAAAAASVRARVCLCTCVHCTRVRMCAETKIKKRWQFIPNFCALILAFFKKECIQFDSDLFNDFFLCFNKKFWLDSNTFSVEEEYRIVVTLCRASYGVAAS